MRSGELHATVRFLLSARRNSSHLYDRSRAQLRVYSDGEPSAYSNPDTDANSDADTDTDDYSITDANTDRVRV